MAIRPCCLLGLQRLLLTRPWSRHRWKNAYTPAPWWEAHRHRRLLTPLSTRQRTPVQQPGWASQQTPDMAVLIRQQSETAPFEPGWVSDPNAFVHRWQDGSWQWTLALWRQPLPAEELERVISSMPGS